MDDYLNFILPGDAGFHLGISLLEQVADLQFDFDPHYRDLIFDFKQNGFTATDFFDFANTNGNAILDLEDANGCLSLFSDLKCYVQEFFSESDIQFQNFVDTDNSNFYVQNIQTENDFARYDEILPSGTFWQVFGDPKEKNNEWKYLAIANVGEWQFDSESEQYFLYVTLKNGATVEIVYFPSNQDGGCVSAEEDLPKQLRNFQKNWIEIAAKFHGYSREKAYVALQSMKQYKCDYYSESLESFQLTSMSFTALAIPIAAELTWPGSVAYFSSGIRFLVSRHPVTTSLAVIALIFAPTLVTDSDIAEKRIQEAEEKNIPRLENILNEVLSEKIAAWATLNQEQLESHLEEHPEDELLLQALFIDYKNLPIQFEENI